MKAANRFNHEATAAAYIQRYEAMLGRPVTGQCAEAAEPDNVVPSKITKRTA
ncbi:MAG: hypothetical protein QM755_17040 [Luteolibacter sp.]